MIPVLESGYATSGEILRQTAQKSCFALICLLFLFQGAVPAQTPRKVYSFDIDGIRLGMDLDYVIKLYNINNISVKKDVYGIINGYEIKKRLKEKKVMVLLNFTGEKRLYRIHYNSRYSEYRYRSEELFAVLLKKYGPPWTDNSKSLNRKKTIYACWGSSCKKYPRNTPVLTARIFHASGRLELMLVDNRIFNKDWKLYKQKLSSQITDRNDSVSKTDKNDALSN